MAKELKCTTCKEPVTNDLGTVRFKCPSCGKVDIVRSRNMRAIAARYVCHECNFAGPTV